MAAEDIFARLADPDCGFSLVVSMFEIYGEPNYIFVFHPTPFPPIVDFFF